MFLEFYFRGSIVRKNAEFSKIYHLGTHLFKPQYFGPYPKNQNFHFLIFILLFLFLFKISLNLKFSNPSPKVSKKACHVPVGQKLRKDIDFQETSHFWSRTVPWRLPNLTLAPKNYLCRVGLALKVLARFIYSIQLLNFFTRTDTHPPIHIQVKNLMTFFNTFHSLH